MFSFEALQILFFKKIIAVGFAPDNILETKPYSKWFYKISIKEWNSIIFMLIDHHTSWHIPWWRSGLLQQGQGTRDLQTWCICWILELVSHHSRSGLVGARHSRSRTSDDDSSWYSVMFEIYYSLKSTGSRSSRGSSTKQLSIMYLSLNNKKAGIRKIFCVIKNKTASSSGSLLKECYWTELWLTAWKHYLLLVDAWLLQLSFLQTSFWNLSATRTLFRRKVV